MTPYEREYFVSRVRSGIFRVKLNNITVKILTPTAEDELISNEIFIESMREAQEDGILTEEEMHDWMIDKGLWSYEKDNKIEGIQKDIERLKVEIFNNRFNIQMVDAIRKYLRAGEKALSKLNAEKNELFSKTCEGIATQEKVMSLFSRCCFIGSEPIDTDDFDLEPIYYQYNINLLSEKQLRELARTDPWRLHWLSRKYVPLFHNDKGRELSSDQKGILVWATMYDNIHESMDCPSEDVIKDDDMLDGWFILQKRKNEAEKAKTEMERRTSNPKISGADEVLIVTGSQKESQMVHSMNTPHAERIRKQRLNTVKNKGKAVDLDFQDRKLEARAELNRQYRDTRRGR